MAILSFTVDTEKDSKDFSGEFQVASPGWKDGVIVDADVKPNKKKNGQVLTLINEIQGGPEHGLRVPDRLNIENPSEVAQRIGRAALAKIALCIGHKGELNNTDILLGRPYQFKVKIEEFKSNKAQPDGTYPMLKSNKITDYRSMADKPATQKPTAEPKPTNDTSGWA